MNEQTEQRLLTPRQFCAQFPWCRIGGLRTQIFKSLSNGLQESGAILRMGRKILIDVDLYFSWMKERGRNWKKAINAPTS